MAHPEHPGVTQAHRAYTDAEIDALLEPEVARWFHGTFPGYTPPQRYAVKEIHERRHTFISSPTGSGKTLSAFLAAINELVALAKRGELTDEVHILYVSPLKALNNDIERNLQGPLEGVRRVFEEAGLQPPDIRVGVRTGDTSPAERQRMTAKPPHIYITTPESLAISLNAPKFSKALRKTRWVIVDEVHALADSKRGTHLLLSLERLGAMAVEPPVRIGLSATCHPLATVARYLVGGRDPTSRPLTLVDVSFEKKTRLDVVLPVPDDDEPPPKDADEATRAAARRAAETRAMYATLDRIIESNRTTLVFTNTRAGTERVVHHLESRFGDKYEDLVGAHHGSLSREKRLEVEERLKAGELKAVVCSTSLELGIDIGDVDCVVLLSSPKGIGRALQRVGRSGHRLHDTSHGVFVAADPEDLVECAVIAHHASEGRLDAIHIPELCLDVLCQHVIGMSLERVWGVHEALDVVREAWPYRDLTLPQFRKVLRYLGGLEALEERRIYGKIWYDEEADTFGRRGRAIRPIYYMNVGTIPDTQRAKVFLGDAFIGEIEEDFLETLTPGDVFLLGGKPYEFRSAAGTKVRVRSGAGRRVTVPMWFSERLPMSAELAQAVQAFRADVAARLATDGRDGAVRHCRRTHGLDASAAEAIVDWIALQDAVSVVPAADEVLVEEHEDTDADKTVYVVHTPVGRRATDALGRAFARRVRHLKGCRVEHIAGDAAFALILPLRVKLTPDEARGLFHIDLETELTDALDGSDYLHRRFRHVATRSFLVLRRTPGRRASVGRQQVNARRLIRALERLDPTFPVLTETWREIREDALDLAAAERFLFEVIARRRKVVYKRGLPAASPFALSLVATAFGGDAVERQAYVTLMTQRALETVRGGTPR